MPLWSAPQPHNDVANLKCYYYIFNEKLLLPSCEMQCPEVNNDNEEVVLCLALADSIADAHKVTQMVITPRLNLG